MRRLRGAFLLLAAATTFSAIAQNGRLEFEVASIKRNISPSGNAIGGMVQGNRFISSNATLMQLVRNAYNVQEFQVAGQPGWFETERFDIEARLPEGANTAEWPRMLQSLLNDRFKLSVHKETRDVSALALVVAGNGHKLKAGDRSECNPSNPCGFRASPSEIIGTAVSMEQLATRLSRSLGLMVIDKTGLTGSFSLEVRWTNDEGATPLGRGASAGPALYAALQDQLGLRLESTKASLETLIIDRVERPSGN